MEMTIKQLANELGVGKTTINRVIAQLNLQGKLHRVGNKYMLSEMQIEQIKLKMRVTEESHQTHHENAPIEPELHQTHHENAPIEPESHQTHHENAPIEPESHISMWNRQLTVKDHQIQILQDQLISKDNQIAEKDRQIKLLQEQITQLTNAMENLTTALNAEQALHAGTIQKQLTEHSIMDQSSDVEQPKQKQGLFSRLFGRKEN